MGLKHCRISPWFGTQILLSSSLKSQPTSHIRSIPLKQWALDFGWASIFLAQRYSDYFDSSSIIYRIWGHWKSSLFSPSCPRKFYASQWAWFRLGLETWDSCLLKLRGLLASLYKVIIRIYHRLALSPQNLWLLGSSLGSLNSLSPILTFSVC